MVLHRTPPSRHHRPKDRNNLCDNSSIGSTYSTNSGSKRSEIDQERKFSDSPSEWHVVPFGGAKARANVKEYHPHPCRYDEHERYLSTAPSNDIPSVVIGKQPCTNPINHNDINHPMLKNKRNEGRHILVNRQPTIQPKQMNKQARLAAEEGLTAKKTEEPVKLVRHSVSWSSNNSDSTIETCEETTHQSSDYNLGLKIGSIDMLNYTRAGSGYQSCELDNRKKWAKSGGENMSNENNQPEQSKDNSNNNDETQMETNNNPDKGSNGGESNEDSNKGTNTDESNKESGDATGDSNSEKGRNDTNGNDNEDTASQTNPGFDGETMQKFVIDFKIRSTPAATIGYIHKQFIQEVLTVAPSTTFIPSNRRTIPTPATIETIANFPSNHLLHQKFFHRVDVRDKVSFTHDIYSTVTAMEIKRRVMPFLQEHDIGMWSEEISNNTKVRVCWVLNAHSKVSYRPLMTDKLCKGIDEQKENYGDDNNRLLNQLPKKMHHIEVQTRTVTHQGHQTVACCVMAYKPAAPVIRELVAMLDHDYLGNGTSIVSEAAARELDPGKYIEIINSNTAFHQNTRTISVKYIHDLYWDVKYRPSEKAIYTTVREWIMTGSGVVSIEPTKDTEKEGRYIILCKAEGFPVFRRVLQVMFQTLVKTIEEDEDLKRIALTKFQQYPTIIGPHKIGRYAEKNAKGLLSRIDVPTVPKPAIRPPSNKIEFDFGSAEGFPDMPAGKGVLTRRLNTKKVHKQQTWAAVATPPATTYNGNASVASEPSEAGKSTRSVRTGMTTTDQQTLQSEAMSVLTEFISQARQEDAERRKEEREERIIEREERKAEAEERRRNEDRRDENNRMMFQTMMATLLSQTTTGTTAGTTAALTNSNLNNNTNDDRQSESNKKRNRKSEGPGEEINTQTAVQEQFNTMDVEEMEEMVDTLPDQQNHDVREDTGPPLVQ
jgi:hypothetical protein